MSTSEHSSSIQARLEQRKSTPGKTPEEMKAELDAKMNRASTSRDETLAAKAAMGAEDVAKAKMLAETHHHDPAVLAEVPAEFVAKPKVGGVNE